jgi:hypothetical protein
MKKLLYTFLAVSIIFSACDKDDDDTSDSGNNNTGNNTSSIIGKWNVMTQEDDYIEVDPTGDTMYANETYTFGVDEGPSFMHLEFLLDEQIKITTFTESTQGQDSLITVFAPYYINGVELYITSNEGPFNAGELNTIILLNNTNLHFAVPAFGKPEENVDGYWRFFCEKM